MKMLKLYNLFNVRFLSKNNKNKNLAEKESNLTKKPYNSDDGFGIELPSNTLYLPDSARNNNYVNYVKNGGPYNKLEEGFPVTPIQNYSEVPAKYTGLTCSLVTSASASASDSESDISSDDHDAYLNNTKELPTSPVTTPSGSAAFNGIRNNRLQKTPEENLPKRMDTFYSSRNSSDLTSSTLDSVTTMGKKEMNESDCNDNLSEQAQSPNMSLDGMPADTSNPMFIGRIPDKIIPSKKKPIMTLEQRLNMFLARQNYTQKN